MFFSDLDKNSKWVIKLITETFVPNDYTISPKIC